AGGLLAGARERSTRRPSERRLPPWSPGSEARAGRGAWSPAIIVPSHGPTGDAGFIAGYRAYLTELRDRTAAEKKAGKTADQAVDTVTAAMADRFPDRTRLGQAIRVAYAEAP